MTVIRSEAARRVRILSLAVAPLVLSVSLFSHPYLSGRLPNKDEVADAVVAGTNRWAVVHILAAVASALVAVALLGVRDHLREMGERRSSAAAMPFVIVGSTLYAVLPGMEFAALSAAKTGASSDEIAAVQDSIQSWFTMILVVGSVAFGIGAISFAVAIRGARVGGDAVSLVVAAGLIAMAVSRIVPLAVTQFYLHSVAALAAMWPLAYVMKTGSTSRISASIA